MTRKDFSSETASTQDGGQPRIAPEVARLVSPDAPAEERRRALAGHLPLSMHDQVVLWYQIYTNDSDEDARNLCLDGIAKSSVMALKPILRDPSLNLEVLEFILRARRGDLPTLIILRPNQNIPESVWMEIFSGCSYEILSFFFDSKCPFRLTKDELRAAEDNKQVTAEMKGVVAELLKHDTGTVQSVAGLDDPQKEGDSTGVDLDIAQEQDLDEAVDELESASKFSIAQELNVGDKIKLALSGDKEWRSLLLKDSNKQVSSAVLKNPRITEKEVLILCQNRSTNEELIRIILRNREWMKSYSIRLALTMHPRTPLNQAVRFLSTLGEKDLRKLSKSRNISSALVNTCRRILMAKSRR